LKVNLFYLRANDWEAQNYSPVDGSDSGADNPGRFDAVNIYGDEYFAQRFFRSGQPVAKPRRTAGYSTVQGYQGKRILLITIRKT
jgi:hypothetical protein